MAKRKKYKKNSSFLDFTFNSIERSITHALFATMMEQNGGKPDPWAALGIGLGTGRVKNTNDLVRLGGWLGAMGAFDDEYPRRSKYDIPRNLGKTTYNDSWKLDCIFEAISYGLDVDDYSNQYEYLVALKQAKNDKITRLENSVPKEVPRVVENNKKKIEYLYCEVNLITNGKKGYYITQNTSIKTGDVVKVSTGDDTDFGIVMTIEKHLDNDLLLQIDQNNRILD